ncbi:c6 transcription factor [Fusarium albosuccineum]|uniref:C6 transcription factor n=1 Tax=Fusarium albosuccineum TaxID=1237068 RepID=A0A8H4LDU7_9HYPO|nr:c6 transcription factor [Fusarium albosuccineum]
MLSVILTDFKHHPRPEFSDDEVAKYRTACRENWFTGIETYDINMVASFEHCLALDAQTEGDLALQWRHSSTAARHCLVLGYHREHVLASMPPKEADRIRRLFWWIYFSDKSTVLSLGRASTIQDVDVDVEPLTISSDPGREPWDATLFMFIDYVRIQAQIYEDLYSPASRRRNTGDRQTIVDNLSERLADWHQSWSQLDSSRGHNKRVFDSMFGPTDVSYYSTLTLLHHALNPSASTNIISESCFEAAKKGLRSYMSVDAQYSLLEPESLAFFAVWVHVYSSLTPFVVTFLHCITNSDMSDLDLLKSSLDIMEQTSGLVKSCKRPYEFCKYLYGIADAYMSASPGEVGDKGSSGLADLQLPLNENWPFPELNFPVFTPSFPASDLWASHTGRMYLS